MQNELSLGRGVEQEVETTFYRTNLAKMFQLYTLLQNCPMIIYIL